jgi:hypothetical protein
MNVIGAYVRRHHVALLALFVALGGTAAAASNTLLPRNSVGSAQVINHTLQKADLSRKTIKALKGNRGLSGAQGARGATGAQGPSGTGPGYTATSMLGAVPASSTTTVQTLNLPAGNYLIFAQGGVNNNAPTATNLGTIGCTLAAGTDRQGLSNFVLGANGTTGETEYVTWQIAHTFPATGQATLSCTTNPDWVGNIVSPTISAIRITSITRGS